jgi:predicted flavoprotein YhiN
VSYVCLSLARSVVSLSFSLKEERKIKTARKSKRDNKVELTEEKDGSQSVQGCPSIIISSTNADPRTGASYPVLTFWTTVGLAIITVRPCLFNVELVASNLSGFWENSGTSSDGIPRSARWQIIATIFHCLGHTLQEMKSPTGVCLIDSDVSQ